jgi:puromycin-sensitive aminopeptidase
MVKSIRLVMTAAACAASMLCVMAAAPARAEAPFSFAATPGKLPKDVVPREYAIHIIPDLASLSYRGTVAIEIEVLAPTSRIMLNALDIDIDEAILSTASEKHFLDAVVDKEQQTVSFALPLTLPKGKYQIALTYRGQIGKQGFGFYANNYSTPTGEKTFLGTHMEPTDARRLVPSWDEPVFRARFRLTVDVPASFSAYSNTPIAKDEPLPGGLHRVAFELTPAMSSYLLALVAGKMERTSAQQDGVDIGIVTTAGKAAGTGFALASSRDLLHYYNGYFGVPFPLKKLDQLALPGGFGGAMENWGAITYNEARLLYDPRTSPESTKEDVFIFVAHEMAHQWFGDLVTMAWWDNLWLNEGFASWMEVKATAEFHPEWHANLAANSARETVMALDARVTTHPIQQPIANESQASNAFDTITYEKGQSFLRMLESYLGPDAFRQGIRAYMAQHKYGNTTSADLWSALAKASGKPVEKIAGDWTTQPGFPVVSVDQACVGGQRKVSFSQAQFRLDAGDGVARSWNVPLQLADVGGKVAPQAYLLEGRTASITRAGCDGALFVDPDGVGFYRVQYAPAMFKALSGQLRALPDAARLKFLSDSWGLAGAGALPLASYSALLAQLGDEPRLAVWEQVLGSIRTLDQAAEGSPARERLRTQMRALLAPRLAKLGWDEKAGETVEQRQVRPSLIAALAQLGDAAVIAEGKARFQRYLADPASVPPSLLNAVVRIAGANADAATYDIIKRRAEQAPGMEEKERFYHALASARDPKLAALTLELALSPDLTAVIRNGLVRMVAAEEHRAQAWAFAKAHADALLAGQSQQQQNGYLSGVVAGGSDVALADDMEAFVKAHQPADALTVARRGASAVRVRAKQKALLLPQL